MWRRVDIRITEDDECGAVGGIRIGRGNRSTGRKLAPVTLRPSQIPQDLNCRYLHGAISQKTAFFLIIVLDIFANIFRIGN
jgi:hypothetical protein